MTVNIPRRDSDEDDYYPADVNVHLLSPPTARAVHKNERRRLIAEQKPTIPIDHFHSPYTRLRRLLMMFAASLPLTSRAITTMMPAIHSRLVGGTANIMI